MRVHEHMHAYVGFSQWISFSTLKARQLLSRAYDHPPCLPCCYDKPKHNRLPSLQNSLRRIVLVSLCLTSFPLH